MKSIIKMECNNYEPATLLDFSNEACGIIDTMAGGKPGQWLSSVIVDYHSVVNGVMPESNCGEMADVVPALRLLIKQNAIVIAELEKLKEDSNDRT